MLKLLKVYLSRKSFLSLVVCTICLSVVVLIFTSIDNTHAETNFYLVFSALLSYFLLSNSVFALPDQRTCTLCGFSRKQFVLSRYSFRLTLILMIFLPIICAYLFSPPYVFLYVVPTILLLLLKECVFLPLLFLIKSNKILPFIFVASLFTHCALLIVCINLMADKTPLETMKTLLISLSISLVVALPTSLITTQKAYAKKDI